MTSEPTFAEIEQFPAPLRHVVVGRLRAAIISGSLKPGDRLVESRLTKALKISRPSLREAMRQIEAEGLIEIVPNIGPMVKKLTAQEQREVYDLRAAGEALCARYFASRGSDEQIDLLEQQVNAVELALKHESREEIVRTKHAYYEAFLDGCGSELVQTHVRQLIARTSYHWGLSLRKPGRPSESIGEMRRLVEAIRARDPERAALAALTLVQHAADTSLEAQELESNERAESTSAKPKNSTRRSGY